jgi:hypothetical protein
MMSPFLLRTVCIRSLQLTKAVQYQVIDQNAAGTPEVASGSGLKALRALRRAQSGEDGAAMGA